MRLGELIEMVIRTRGRQYSEDIMTGWLNESGEWEKEWDTTMPDLQTYGSPSFQKGNV